MLEAIQLSCDQKEQVHELAKAGRQAGKHMREAAVDAQFYRPYLPAFLPVLAICFFLSLFFAPVMEVLVQFKVKA